MQKNSRAMKLTWCLSQIMENLYLEGRKENKKVFGEEKRRRIKEWGEKRSKKLENENV